VPSLRTEEERLNAETQRARRCAEKRKERREEFTIELAGGAEIAERKRLA
jgi:hypothetical protein